MQPQGHMQVVIGTLDHGLNPQAVLDAPRWRVLDGLDAVIEPGAGPEIQRDLTARGHRLMSPDPGETYQFGRGQVIWSLEDGVYVAGSDPRADGLVAAGSGRRGAAMISQAVAVPPHLATGAVIRPRASASRAR